MCLAVVLVTLIPFLSFFALRLLMSGFSTPEKRAQIKESLTGFVTFLIAVPVAYLAYGILVKFSGLISLYLLGSSFSITGLTNFSGTLISLLSSETLVGVYNTATLFAMITISMQRILLVLGAVLLPVSLAFVFLSSGSLKNLGNSLLMFFSMIIFLPVIDSLIFQCAELAIPVAESAEFLVLSSYWLVALVNVLVFFAAFSISKSGSGVKVVRGVIELVKKEVQCLTKSHKL